MKRREFLYFSAAVTGLLPVMNACKAKRKITGKVVGSSANIGHLLRDKNFDKPTEILSKDVVIIGGGISGLSAGRWLQNNGLEDFLILDLENAMGGNAANGKNEISAYPWGAHYIPTPNNDLLEYLDFLKESNVITHFNDAGLPVYNDYYLCFDPQERLYINGRWQEGLIPDYGVPDNEKKEIKTFFELMKKFRYAKGKDGKDAFAIPVDNSSNEDEYKVFDSITMKQWLIDQRLESKYLHWYIDYCTRDDFGTPYNIISAWAAIHYFAARKGKGANAEPSDVLTWPEGNGFLVKGLSKRINDKFLNGTLAVSVLDSDNHVLVNFYDTKTNSLKAIKAKSVIISTPQFINSRLLPQEKERAALASRISYSPWMVANLKVKGLIERNGAPFSWDNVLFDSPSLGYVHASQQLVSQRNKNSYANITYYLPLTSQGTVKEARLKALQTSHEDWLDIITGDLKMAHPNIEEAVEHADIMLWGHAMAQPLPGTTFGQARYKLQEPINNKIYFAHTDLAGLSIFEEGFYQGIKAAKEVLKNHSA